MWESVLGCRRRSGKCWVKVWKSVLGCDVGGCGEMLGEV